MACLFLISMAGEMMARIYQKMMPLIQCEQDEIFAGKVRLSDLDLDFDFMKKLFWWNALIIVRLLTLCD